MIDRVDDVNRTEPPATAAFAQRYRGEAMLEVRDLLLDLFLARDAARCQACESEQPCAVRCEQDPRSPVTL